MSEYFHGEPDIKRVPVTTVRATWICPKEGCGGEMIATGLYQATNPPAFVHVCNKCHTHLLLDGKRFPSIEYVWD